MKLVRLRPLKHHYYNDCSVANCESDSLVLIQLSEWTFAWLCGKHYMRNIIQHKFGY